MVMPDQDNQDAGAREFQVTEVRVKLTEDPRNKLKAYCSVTIDNAFVVRDLKIIEGNRGPFVAMPSRKLSDHCVRCHHKNHLRASFCNHCGTRLDPERAPKDDRGRARLHADLAHPINSVTRIEVHKAVVRAYAQEVATQAAAGESYRPKSFEDFDQLSEVVDDEYLEELERRQEARERRRRERASEVAGEAASKVAGEAASKVAGEAASEVTGEPEGKVASEAAGKAAAGD
jgi:stage V sporulation protein G